ncbi:MAG: hypothetical protein NTZ24_12405 [Deltaproteobacteria bacterium]|nr:hypothetical protein [Deltaproteobacteria bacterium]
MINKSFPISKIVYFVEAYFNESDYRRFGVKTFKDNGFDVEVWDFTPFIASGEYKSTVKPPVFNCDNWRLFQTKKEAITAVARLDDTCFVVSLIHYAFYSLSIHRMFSKQNIKYSVDAMALPRVDRSKVVFSESISNKFKQLNLSGLINSILYLIPYQMLNVKPADYILARGEKYGTPGLAVTATSNVVWAHSYDYDTYLTEADKLGPVDINTGVFIDEYLPFHPDYAYSGLSTPVTPDEYYPKLCRFFDYLESKNRFKIFIAAHPRSRYEDLPDYFGGRPVIRGKTSELVRTSGFVILHTSTAVNFAVLYEKPIIIVTTDKYNEGWAEDPTPDWMAGFFGKKVHNLDYHFEFNLQKELYVDVKKYRAYRNDYIKKDGTEELQSWQILANRIKNIK